MSSVSASCWKIRGGRALCVSPFCVMGIVNLTPDSFYDGGLHHKPDAALQHALRLLREGAHILDLGAESSRPGALPVPAPEEQARLVPVLRALREQPLAARAVLGVDTRCAATARAALEAGADIINDISAAADPRLLEVLVEYGPGYVLMHSQGNPENMQHNPRYARVVDEVAAFFAMQLERLCAAGLAEEKIVLDPGIGFGKRLEDNIALLRAIPRFVEFGRPILLGLSMKSVFGELLGLAPEDRGLATQLASALLLGKGALVHRVHDVAANLLALRLAHALEG